MTIEPERYELWAGPAHKFAFGRRGFFKALGGGIVVCLVLANAPARRNQAADAAASGNPRHRKSARGCISIGTERSPSLQAKSK